MSIYSILEGLNSSKMSQNIKVSLIDSRGNSNSINNMIEIGHSKEELLSEISSCPKEAKKVSDKLNALKWQLYKWRPSKSSNSEAGFTLLGTDAWDNKYTLIIKYI